MQILKHESDEAALDTITYHQNTAKAYPMHLSHGKEHYSFGLHGTGSYVSSNQPQSQSSQQPPFYYYRPLLTPQISSQQQRRLQNNYIPHHNHPVYASTQQYPPTHMPLHEGRAYKQGGHSLTYGHSNDGSINSIYNSSSFRPYHPHSHLHANSQPVFSYSQQQEFLLSDRKHASNTKEPALARYYETGTGPSNYHRASDEFNQHKLHIEKSSGSTPFNSFSNINHKISNTGINTCDSEASNKSPEKIESTSTISKGSNENSDKQVDNSHEQHEDGTVVFDDMHKRRRMDTRQLHVLESVFEYTYFPSTELRQELAQQLGLTSRTIQIWFQNKRQNWRNKAKVDDFSAASQRHGQSNNIEYSVSSGYASFSDNLSPSIQQLVFSTMAPRDIELQRLKRKSDIYILSKPEIIGALSRVITNDSSEIQSSMNGKLFHSSL